MATMRGGQATGARNAGRVRAVGVVAAVAAAVLVLGLAAWRPSGPAPGGSPGPGGSNHAQGPSGEPAAVSGPLVYYEVLDAAGSRLMVRRLDGTSLARVVAERTAVDYGRTWTVDPTGTVAIDRSPGTNDQGLEAVDIATGQVRWSIRTPEAGVDQAAWARDGSRLALTTIGSDVVARELLIVDAASGALSRVTIPDDAVVQGVAPDGAVILRRHLPAPDGENRGWDLLRADPATPGLQVLTTLPDVGPASDTSEDVDPGAGVAVDLVLGPNDEGTTVRLWRLAGGAPPTNLITLPSADQVAIDPTGTGVAIGAAGTIRFVAFDGRSSEVFRGDDPIADFSWSETADYLAVATDRNGPNLTIVERATGRSVALPYTGAVAQLLLVRVVGGVPLPESPLPAVEPTPSPTAAPEGPDVSGFAGILSAWIDATGPRRVLRLDRLVPTTDGGMRVAASMQPIDLPPAPVPDDGGPEIQLLPRPGTGDVLVWLSTPEQSSGWLWDGASTLSRLALPADWPANAYDVAWRPDGGALAASAARSTADDFEAVFVVAALTARTTTVVPVVGEYDRLEGWWSGSELRVGHGICTEGCTGRYAWSARLRIRDHRLTQMTPADRHHAPIDEFSADATSIVLSAVNEDTADDIAITWPSTLGPIDSVTPVGFAGDGRTLLVTVDTPTGTDVIVIPDPVGRAVGGRVSDARATVLAHLDGGDLRIDVSPDAAWALVTDRVEDVRLVRLADGKSWPIDRDRILVWAGG